MATAKKKAKSAPKKRKALSPASPCECGAYGGPESHAAWCQHAPKAQAKQPPGRPTSYDPSLCAKVIEWGKLGKSIAWMASQLDVNKDTVYEWAKVHEEFSDALTRAKTHAQAVWEDKGETGMVTPGFSASIWSRSMAARFPDDWREKTETALTGANGGPVQIVATPHDETL